jgi:ribosome maturation protein Sdo1
MDAASNQSLESEFDTTKQEDVIKIILQKGDVQDTQVSFFYLAAALVV